MVLGQGWHCSGWNGKMCWSEHPKLIGKWLTKLIYFEIIKIYSANHLFNLEMLLLVLSLKIEIQILMTKLIK